MIDSPETSLERFMRARGSMLGGQIYSQRAFGIQSSIGYSLCAMAGGFMLLPLFGASDRFALSAIGPLIAGLTNIAVPLAMRKRMAGNYSLGVTVSREARSVLNSLNWKYTWARSPWYAKGSSWGSSWSGGTDNSWTYGCGTAPSRKISEEALDLLESAAYQYNRISGALETQTSSGGPLSKLTPKIVPAADQAMADLFHQAYFLSQYPEGQNLIQVKVLAGISDLKEMAQRVESLALAAPTILERTEGRSGIQDVLDELRMEHIARNELSAGAPGEQETRVRNEAS